MGALAKHVSAGARVMLTNHKAAKIPTPGFPQVLLTAKPSQMAQAWQGGIALPGYWARAGMGRSRWVQLVWLSVMAGSHSEAATVLWATGRSTFILEGIRHRTASPAHFEH